MAADLPPTGSSETQSPNPDDAGDLLAGFFFQQNPQPCVVLSPKGAVLRSNQAFEQAFGSSGQPIARFSELLDADAAASFSRFADALKDAPAHFVQAFAHPDGGQRRWSWMFFLHERKLYGRAKPIGRLPEGGLLYNALFDSAAIGIAVLDPRGRMADVNDAFVQLLGHPKSALLGGRGLDLVHRQDRSRVREEERKLMRRQSDRYSLELRLRKANRRRVWVVLTVSPIDLGTDQRFFLATVENIHQRVKAEQHLHVRAEELARSNDELQRFAVMASHDLQQPIRTVANFMQLLERSYIDQLDRDGQDLVRQAASGAKRMQCMIRDMLDYSRVQSGYVEFEPVNLNEVLEAVNRNLQQILEQHKAQVMNELLPTVVANRTQMVQLFQNLVENAVKFNAAGRIPEVIISAKDQGKRFLISISDNGVGIEKEAKDAVFSLFHRLHRVSDADGTGVGLALCQRIVHNHGGKIWLESEPGEGATFHFTLVKRALPKSGKGTRGTRA
jgi:PAS domain S-box-containing protein